MTPAATRPHRRFSRFVPALCAVPGLAIAGLAVFAGLAASDTARAQDGNGGRAGAMAERMDTDGDGTVSREERRAFRDTMRTRRAGMMMRRMDGDEDGSISQAEFQAHAADRFTRMDANGDGGLSPDELEKGMGRRGGDITDRGRRGRGE